MSAERSTPARPLAGKRVLVTRPKHQSGALSDLLREAGAIPIELPVIEIVPSSNAALDEALGQMDRYAWIVFTSVNTVRVVTDGRRIPDGVKIAAVGAATTAALVERGMSVDLVPEEFVAEAVLEEFLRRGVREQRILFPRAEVARDTIPDGLRRAGASVDVVIAYSTRRPVNVDASIIESLRDGAIDIVTFTSPSTVRNLLNLTGGSVPETICIACIGPVTARAAEECGLRVNVVAAEYSAPGLVQALIEMGITNESA